MGIPETDIPEPQRLALAHARHNERDQWRLYFSLDHALGRIVAGTSEPILGQMRLAWWRDQLEAPKETRPKGNPLLEAISDCWSRNEDALVELVNAWELLLVTEIVDDETLSDFAQGRTVPIVRLAKLSDIPNDPVTIRDAAQCWALTDLSMHLSDEEGRESVRRMAKHHAQNASALDRSMRPLAILAGLSKRALEQASSGLLGDRLSPLVALRLGLFGR